MIDLADQAEGLRRLFAARRARILTVVGTEISAGAAGKLALAFAQLPRRTVLISCDRQTAAGIALTDLPNIDYHFEVGTPAMPIELYQAGEMHASQLSPQAKSRIFDRLTDLQNATDIMLIDARQTLAEARTQAREIILAIHANAEGIVAAYARIKTFHAWQAGSRCVVYTFDDSPDGEGAGDLAAHNLAITAQRFLGVTVRHLGSVANGSEAAYRGIASRLAAATAASDVAIESCLAYLFLPQRDGSVPAGALLLQ